jgi:ribosomal protein L37AE/L43A
MTDHPTLPAFLDTETWHDFMAYRATEIRKPLSPIGLKRMLSVLTRLHADGYDCNALLDKAMAEGWRGVWACEECKRKVRPASHGDGTMQPQGQVSADGRARLELVKRAVK